MSSISSLISPGWGIVAISANAEPMAGKTLTMEPNAPSLFTMHIICTALIGFRKCLATAIKKVAIPEPVELPKFSAGAPRFILSAEAASAFDDITRDGRINELSGQSPGDWPNSFRTSRFVTAVEYLRAQRARTLLMRAMDEFMDHWDVFISPAPGSASLLVTNLTGHPAVVVPCGFINKQPQAIMFTAGLYEEGAALRIALAYERATPWHEMQPPEFASK